MPIERRDIKMKNPNGYFEYASMRGVEMKVVDNVDCLVQEFIGYLKTTQGEIYGIGLGNYGSNLKTFLGEDLNEDNISSIEQIIQRAPEVFPEILLARLNDVYLSEDEGYMYLDIELKTVYGIVLEVIPMMRGC